MLIQNSRYFTNVGIGVYLNSSSDNLITQNTVISPHMVKNDTAPGNDYGANGVWLENNCSRNDITNNTLSKCRAASHDYVFDGGALELSSSATNSLCDDNLFSGNRIDEGVGVIEIGAVYDPAKGVDGRNGKVSNLTIQYNACYKNGNFMCFSHRERDEAVC